MKFEEVGVKEAQNAAFVLVAGGLGECLGYSGIKVALPQETTTGTCFLQHYIENILALQEASCKMTGGQSQRDIPFAIMTSDDTHARTVQLLESNSYFGMKSTQIKLLKQEKVACLVDNDARLALDPQNYRIQTKPHGHGDVHALLYSSGTLEEWQKGGVRWVLFFQDTNGLLFKAIPASLEVSASKGYHVNSLAVPRKAKEAIGGITKLTHTDGRSMVINVKYNQLDPLLRATGFPDGDANCETGYSPFPGNINQLIVEVGPYLEELMKTGGAIKEFVNPNDMALGLLTCGSNNSNVGGFASRGVILGFALLYHLSSYGVSGHMHVGTAKLHSPPPFHSSGRTSLFGLLPGPTWILVLVLTMLLIALFAMCSSNRKDVKVGDASKGTPKGPRVDNRDIEMANIKREEPQPKNENGNEDAVAGNDGAADEEIVQVQPALHEIKEYHLDLREYIASKIQNQDDGECAYHTFVAALEIDHNKQKPEKIQLSVQELLDNVCLVKSNEGTLGMQFKKLAKYIKSPGLGLEKDHPRRKKPKKGSPKKFVRIDSFEEFFLEETTMDENHIKEILWSGRPVIVSVDATPEFHCWEKKREDDIFQGSKRPTKEERELHAILVVGFFSKYGKVQYWIVRNSWSEKWGYQGYTRVRAAFTSGKPSLFLSYCTYEVIITIIPIYIQKRWN
ncbi:UDP-sugar pyrophosphorylase [Linum grandiflorum]